MIFALGHGQRLVWLSAAPPTPPPPIASVLARGSAGTDPDAVPVEAALPDARSASGRSQGSPDLLAAIAEPPEAHDFEFLFPDAGQFAPEDRAAAIAALARAMTEAGEGQEGDEGDAEIAPVMTYLGQFIDHDITAGTNTEDVEDLLRIGNATVVPQDRTAVLAGLRNLRRGNLGLDSVYGDGPLPGPVSERLQAALRDPADRNRMRVGELFRLGSTTPPEARVAGDDNALDLPRVGAVVGSAEFPTPSDLPEALRPKGPGDARWDRRAFIGDSRNDENLIVAQTHVAFLKLHNSFVERGRTFDEARRSTTWHYQWIVANEYLPAVCDADTLSEVVAARAPLYRMLIDRLGGTSPRSFLPLPMEFSAAAFRFGHSMVRGEYDFNANFNPEGVRGTFELMFAFTGNHPTPIGVAASPALPDNWPIDWARFVDAAGPSGRRARRIDTRLTPPLFDMVNESPDPSSLFRRLAERNLRRGHVLNLPPAQALIAKLREHGLGPGRVLTPDEIAEGPTGDAIRSGGFLDQTPLWFYVLKEAELLGDGGRLGPLGTRIVAETLMGLIVADPDSYLNRESGPWSPEEEASAGHAAIKSISDLFRAAGVMS